MDRILSWKIDSSTYAYIYPIKNSYISNRIPENSPLWGEIINEISAWTKDTYRANFDRMASEVKSKYGQTIPWQDQYWDFSDDNTNLPVNIVLLAGKDGDGSGNGGNGTGGGDGIEVYEELRDAINKELDKAKKDIEEQNKRVEEFVEQKVGETIAEAKNTIAETKKELANTREELETKLEGAAEALDKAAALFELGEGNITGEQIKEALSSVEEYGGWLEEYSGTVQSLKTDYDLATQRMGSIGEAEDVTDGLFARFATSLNVVSGTVGNVERSMNASLGKIEDFASWYDENADTAAEATRLMNAMSGQIVDTINFISGDGLTTRLTREMNAMSGTIKDVVMTETSGAVTNVRNELNALSGIVETSVTRLNTIDGDLTSLGSRMNAEEQKMEQWMNVSDSAMSLSHDLRDTWSVESGKLSTVANLTAETDGDGNIIYYVSGATGDEIIVSHDGVNWVDEHGTTYAEERVYVHWSQAIGSYIQQQASSITMSVMNSSGLTAAIKLAIERGESGEEESIIKMVSDKLIITGEMIAQAISANTANIGGIHMGMGQVWSEAKNGNGTPKFRLDGVNGTLYASDADISGTIHAKSLILGNNQSIENYVTSQIPTDWTSEADVKQMITAFVSTPEFKDSIIEMGYVTEDYLKKWAESQSGLTEEQVKELIETMAGAKVNGVLPDIIDTDGGIIKRVKIGGVEHTWKVYPGDKMVLLGTEIGENFLIDTEGLMTAHNAIVYGTIYATDGWFKGSVSADSGYFRGDIVANSLTLGTAATETLNGIIKENIPDGDFITLGEEYGGNFKVSKSGLLTANNAVISGTIYAQKGIIGQLSLANGILSSATFNLSSSGLVIQGSMRQQFMEYKSNTNTNNQEYYDNLYLSEKKSSGTITLPSLPCNAKQIGRRITLVNNDNGRRVNKMGTSKITLPNDYFFFEDGFASNSLTISNETVELLGYGLNASSTFFGWIVTRRTPMMSVPIYGHEMKVLASGRVKIATASKAEISRLYTCDKTTTVAGTWAGSGNETKDYKSNNFGYMFANAASYASPYPICNIHFPKKWFSGCTSDDVFLQAIPLTKYKVWVSEETTSAVTVSCESGICSFDFILYNRKGWDTLPERFNTELEVSTTSVTFNYDSSGSGRKQTITCTKTPSNGSLTYNVKYKSGQQNAFTCSLNGTTFSVYPNNTNNGGQPNEIEVTFTLTYFEDVRTVKVKVVQYRDDSDDPAPCATDTY